MSDALNPSVFKSAAQNFNALKLRERCLFVITILVSISVVWWYFYVEPIQLRTKVLIEENNRVGREVQTTRNTINDIRSKIAGGINRDKTQKLAQLESTLEAMEQRLRQKTIELIDPDEMFQLMTRLVYRDSRLKLLSLNRREVKPAIDLDDEAQDEATIYRHVLEVKFSGKFQDILKYMQNLENLDWKLIWDEMEIVTDEYPLITVRVVISTLSTRKEWVGV